MTELAQGNLYGIQLLKDGGASSQLDENQLQTMDVSLDQKATTTAAMQRAGTTATNNVESGIGDLRSVPLLVDV